MKVTQFAKLFAIAALAIGGFAANASAASITFANFNVDEGTFANAPGFSGSNANIAATSTANRVTTQALEGVGSQELVFNATASGSATRVRFLSGGGTPANNTSFTTSAGVDGWIGFALKTTTAGYTAQLWLEGASNNGGVEKTIVADGQWHFYEWNLDDTTGGANGWGPITGILAGVATVADGSHTMDSIVFRSTTGPATATIYMDFIAKSDSGSIANLLVPEPATFALAGMGMIGLVAAARRKNA
jgi:hypothetical protein